jgi:hypothetical protein
MATLYSPRSTADFPEHALSLLVKSIGLDRSNRCKLNAKTNHPSSRLKIPSSLNIYSKDRSIQARSIDRSLLEPFLQRIVKSRDWIQQYQDSSIEVAHIVSESDTHYLEGRYWRFHQPIEFESSLTKSSPESIERVFIDPTQPTTTHGNYLFRSDLLTISIDRDRQIDCHSTIDTLCEGDRYLLDFIYPHLFQAYQNSIFFTENQQRLIEIGRAKKQSFSIELAQSLGLTK